MNMCQIVPRLMMVVVMSACAVTCASLPIGRSGQCESDGYLYYHDHGTELCELCEEICDFAEIQGTEEQCRNNCPRYIRAMTCKQKDGQYFDELHNSCESCCQLCELSSPANVPQFSSECRQKCSDFVIQLTSSKDLSQPGNKVVSPPCAISKDTRSLPPNNYDLQTVIIIIVCAVVSCLIIIAAVFCYFRTLPKVRYWYVHTFTQGSRGIVNSGQGSQLQQPVEESGTRCFAAVMAEDGTINSTLTTVKMAFPDLSARHDRSHQEHV